MHLSLLVAPLPRALRHWIVNVLVLVALAATARATAPTVSNLTASNTSPGSSSTISSAAHDDDGDLSSLYFYVNSPNWSSGWLYVGSVGISGTDSSASIGWSASSTTGTWHTTARALDGAGNWDSTGGQIVDFDDKNTQSVSSSDTTIQAGQAFTPTYNGGGGTGVWQFVIGAYTNWGGTQPGTLLYPSNQPATSWTPPGAGTYQFWIQKLGDNDYYAASPAGPYTLTVNAVSQQSVGISYSSPRTTVLTGTTVTFTASGGSGSGAWIWTGASGSGNTASQTFSSPGTYTITVYKAGDGTYSSSNTASVTITVKDLNQSLSFSDNPPRAFTTYEVSYSALVSGDWTSVEIWKNGGYFTSGNFSTQGYTSDPAGPMPYEGDFTDNDALVSGHENETANIATAPQTVSISPQSTTATAQVDQVQFTASGGAGGGSWVWGGDASGQSGNPVYVTFNATGSRTVTVYKNGDANYDTSNTATATITVGAPSAPSITSQPATQTVFQGQGVSFSAAATGSPTLAFQWYHNNTAISGATGGSYSIASAQPGDAGGYYVVVSNSYGSAQSNTATLTVTGLPSVTSGSVSGSLGSPITNYQIQATNGPISNYGASGLPSGVSVNVSTGVISGTPTQSGTFSATITAHNGAGTGSGTLTLNIAGPPPTYTLTVSASPGIDGSTAGTGSYTSGTSVQITASPNDGYAFLGWSGAITGNTNPTTVTVTSNMSVTANFIPITSGGTNVPVQLTVMSNGPGNVTINTGPSTSTTFTFSGSTGQWQKPTASTNSGFGWTLLNTRLGVLNNLTATADSSNAFIITATIDPELARNLNATAELNGYLTGSIQSGELASGGSFTLTAVANGQVPFAVMDTSKLEVNRILTFGMGGNRSGLTAGRVVFSAGNWVYGGGSMNMDIIDGPAEKNRWNTSPTHFQAQVPDGYIDVSQDVGTTTISYYTSSVVASFNSSTGYNDFKNADQTVATPLAKYVITGSIAAPGDGSLGTGNITRTIAGDTNSDVLEFTTQSTYSQGANQSSTSGVTNVTTRYDTYDSVAQFWTWHLSGKTRTGLTVVEGTSSRTGMQFDNNAMNFQYNPPSVSVTRYDGATTSATVDSFEKHDFNVGDMALLGTHYVSRGVISSQNSENHIVTGSSYGDETYKNRPITTYNSTGGRTYTDYLSYAADGLTTNLRSGDPVFAIGQPMSTHRSFLDGDVNTSTDLITTYTYNSELIDDNAVVATAVTQQGTTTLGNVSYTYTPDTFDSLPMIKTQAVSHTDASGTLSTTTKSYSERIGDLDRRGKPISVVNPDGTQVSFAYLPVTYDTSAHTWSTTGACLDLLVAELHGKANAAGGSVGTYAGANIDPLDMDPNRSTVVERIFDAKGELRREATYVYQTGGTFAQLNATWFDYDDLGRLTLKEDSSGLKLYQAGYTGSHKDSETDEQGVMTSYTYDDYEHIQTATRSDVTYDGNTVPGQLTTYAYDEIGRLKSETVGSGSEKLVSTYTYDTSDRPKTRVTPGSFTTSFEYPVGTGQFSQYCVETDTTLPGNGTKKDILYADGRVCSVSGSAVLDITTAYSFDTLSGDLVTTRTPLVGPTTKTTTDWLGRVVSVSTDTWSGGSRVVSNTYDSSTGQLTEQDTKSGSTSIAPAHLYHYDSYGRLDMEGLSTSGTGAISPTTDYDVKQYDSIYQTGAPGYTTNVYRYDTVRVWPFDGTNASTSRLASETYTQVSGLSATTAGHVLSIDLDRNSTDTTTTVDASNHATTTTAALGLASTSTSVSGNVTTSTTTVTALGPTITTINANGLDVSSTNAQNLTTTKTYDTLRRLHTIVDPRTGTTTYTYWSGATLADTVSTPDGRTTTFVFPDGTRGYDAAGRVTAKKDNPDVNGVSKYAYFQYDAAGNLTYQWGDTVNPVHFEYNDANQRTTMHTYRNTDGGWATSTLPTGFSATGDLTTWNYKAGLLDSKTDNSGAGMSYHYNELGQMTQRTDSPNGTTYYDYYDTTDNRLKAVRYPDTTITPDLGYTYTRAGQLKTVTDAAGTRKFDYYDSGTNTNGVTQNNPDGNTDDTGLLNKSDRLMSETLDSTWYGGHAITYTYNYGTSGKLNGSISGMSLNTSTAYGVAYDYDNVLRLDKITYNNSVTPFNYTYVTDSNGVANSNLVATVTHGTSTYLDYTYEPYADRISGVKASWGVIATV